MFLLLLAPFAITAFLSDVISLDSKKLTPTVSLLSDLPSLSFGTNKAIQTDIVVLVRQRLWAYQRRLSIYVKVPC